MLTRLCLVTVNQTGNIVNSDLDPQSKRHPPRGTKEGKDLWARVGRGVTAGDSSFQIKLRPIFFFSGQTIKLSPLQVVLSDTKFAGETERELLDSWFTEGREE
ncbi:hypothetical protein ACOMHN_041270 [Nucella lapillus]